MKLFLYYSLHSIKNQIKKLFKTWVTVFVIVMVLFGAIMGGIFGSSDNETPPSDGIEVTENDEMTPEKQADLMQVVELVCGGVILIVIVLNMYNADKSGSSIFTMADVNLLFSAPMKPQSVLLFKLSTQLGLILFGSIYILFQLPNLMLNLGLGLLPALAIVFTWLLTLAYGKLINVLIYTVASSKPSLKKFVLPFALGIPLIVAASFAIYYYAGASDIGIFAAAKAFFNSTSTRFIPIYGWLKGLVMYTFEGNYIGTLWTFLALAAGMVVLCLIIWNIKADFYEDAMAKSAETAELMEDVKSGRRDTAIARRKKKDRSEKLLRDGLNHGSGANVFFFKEMYNRFRFAYFKVFTKTSITYIFAVVAICTVMRVTSEIRLIAIPALALALFSFFRALGNPVVQDIKTDYFVMVPASPYAKLFWSVLAGSTNCLLDLLPAMLVACIALGANPLEALAWVLFIATTDYYCSNVGVFLDLSIPVNAGKNLKTMIQVMFVYFGLAPDVVLVIIGFTTKLLPLFVGISAIVNVVIGSLFFLVNPLFINNGRK